MCWRSRLDHIMKLETVEQLFMEGLQYAYDAEKQLTEALPKMAQASSTSQLKQAFEQHLKETQEHVKRDEQIFQQMGRKPEGKSNTVVAAMRGEAEQLIKNTNQSPVRDAALIVAGNQVEHFEMATYGSLANYAQLLGRPECVTLLKQILDEEKKADANLTEVGENYVNKQALQASSSATVA